MLKIFNFLKTGSGKSKLVTMRQRFEQVQDDLNAVLAELPEMPNITIDTNGRIITIETPDQFPDEALALPAPEQVQETASAKGESASKEGLEAENSVDSEVENKAA